MASLISWARIQPSNRHLRRKAFLPGTSQTTMLDSRGCFISKGSAKTSKRGEVVLSLTLRANLTSPTLKCSSRCSTTLTIRPASRSLEARLHRRANYRLSARRHSKSSLPTTSQPISSNLSRVVSDRTANLSSTWQMSCPNLEQTLARSLLVNLRRRAMSMSTFSDSQRSAHMIWMLSINTHLVLMIGARLVTLL